MRVSGLRNEEKKLSTLMKAADNGDFSIPVFQRDYVWKKSGVLSLADSVLRGYPIGSLLIMPTTGALQVPGVAMRTAGAKLRNGGVDYVMDGQQRLTSLYKVFIGSDEENYYFDQLAVLADEYPEDNLPDVLTEDKYSRINPNDENFCKAFRSTEDSRQKFRYVSCRSVLTNTYSQTMMAYLDYIVSKGVPPENKVKYLNFLLGLFSQVPSFQIPVVEIAEDTSLEMIIHIFAKVNGSGQKLEPLDLLNAKTYSARDDFDGGISNYITDKIKLWPIYQDDDFRQDIDDFFKYDKQGQSFKNLNSIVRGLFLGDFLAKGVTRPNITPAKILERDAVKWYSDWDANEALIRKLFTWASKNGVFNVTSPSLFEYVMGVCIGVPEAFDLRIFRDALVRYIYSRPIADIKFSLAETGILLDYAEYGRELLKVGVNYRERVVEPGKKAIQIDRSHIVSATSGKKSFQAILGIMYYQNFQSKFATDIFGESFHRKMQLHHIVPKASWIDGSDLYDTIANLVYLNAEANQYKLRDCNVKAMKARLLEHYSDDGSAVAIALNSNLMPTDQNDHLAFMSERADMVLLYVKAFFGIRDAEETMDGLSVQSAI